MTMLLWGMFQPTIRRTVKRVVLGITFLAAGSPLYFFMQYGWKNTAIVGGLLLIAILLQPAVKRSGTLNVPRGGK